MRTIACAILMLIISAPALAGGPIPAAEIKDHLWEYADAAALATELDGKLATRKFKRDGTKVKGGLAVGVVDAPMEQVLKVVRDYEQYKKLMKFFTKSLILGEGGNRTRVHVKISIAKGAVKLWANVSFVESDKDAVRVVEAELEEGNMKRMDARWELIPIDEGHTLVMMRLLVDPDLQLASDSKATEMNQVNARRAIRSVRERVKSY
jgi:ribosome-associated toxin RatA of RatAB toxin-antitoxin module